MRARAGGGTGTIRARGPGVAVVLATLVALLAPATPAAAQSKTGTTLGQFLLIEPSARFTAMGNAGAAGGESW